MTAKLHDISIGDRIGRGQRPWSKKERPMKGGIHSIEGGLTLRIALPRWHLEFRRFRPL
jgi:hypothetical protein